MPQDNHSGNTKNTRETKSEVFCADCSRLMLYHPALGRFICVACSDQPSLDLDPYTGSDGL